MSGASPEQHPPSPLPDHDLGAERAVLAALLVDGADAVQRLEATGLGLAPEHFFQKAHERIFSACLALALSGEAVELLTVYSWLRARGQLQTAGGSEYIGRIVDREPAPESLETHARTVREAAAVRALRAQLERLSVSLQGPVGDRAAVLAEARAQLVRTAEDTQQLTPRQRLRTAKDFAGEPPPADWICERLHLAPGRPSALVGYSGAGKTALVADLALAVAGEPQHASCWGGIPVQRQGRVLHLDLEVGEKMLWRRYKRLATGRWAQIEAWGDRLCWDSYPRLSLVQRDAETVFARLCEGFALVILDSLRKLLPGVDENDPRTGDYLGILARLSAKLGTCFLVLHHEGKPGQEGPKEARYAGRGTSAFQGEWGSQWRAASIRTGERKWIHLEHGKSDQGDEQEPWRCQLIDTGEKVNGVYQGLRFVAVGSEDVERAKAADEGPGALQRAKRSILSHLEAVGEESYGALKTALKKINNDTFSRALHELVEGEQRVIRTPQGKTKLYRLATSSQRAPTSAGTASATPSQPPPGDWEREESAP